MNIKRRDFIKTTAIAGAGLAIAPSFAFGKRTPDSKLRLGFIGVGLRGVNHLNNALRRKDIEITAICDIDAKRLELCQKLITETGQKKAA